ncbi:GAF domain-containing sensor histidine kinase [Maribius pontilimi]|uniref:histidine kinase n=1 Tax=Palleronia pontilimi TaxID=1964209 RepID=A0A934IF47_9RHOB|nr:GAF domain-containing sensor histidine kinase [Palleronia pontilimi]MBJ3761728.1 GAF domain-containing sensor histidine kinase [Palleronia pontilimi]
MRSYPIPSNEDGRIAAIRATDALGDAPHGRLDEITEELAAAFDCPTALVSIVDTDRQYFRSRYGLDACETSREKSICAHVIMAPRQLVIRDTHADPRFRNHPVVVDPPNVRFYAGTPIILHNNFRAGSLCVLDFVPREAPSPEAVDLLTRRAVEVGQIISCSSPGEAMYPGATDNVFSEEFLDSPTDAIPETAAIVPLSFRRRRPAAPAPSPADPAAPRDDAARQRAAPPESPAMQSVDDVDAAELARREFLCLVGHELRTPLTVLMGYAKLLEHRVSDGPDKVMTSAITRMGDHLHAVVESVLTYSDLVSGERMLNEDRHDIEALLEDCASLIRPSVEVAGKTLVVDSRGAQGQVTVDREQMKLVLVSLLKNAVTHGGKRIRFRAALTDAGHLSIQIEDDGAPISDAQARQVFEPFKSGARLDNRGREGLGLGLALTKRIVEMHGGEISLAQGDGGKTFTILMPDWRM